MLSAKEDAMATENWQNCLLVSIAHWAMILFAFCQKTVDGVATTYALCGGVRYRTYRTYAWKCTTRLWVLHWRHNDDGSISFHQSKGIKEKTTYVPLSWSCCLWGKPFV